MGNGKVAEGARKRCIVVIEVDMAMVLAARAVTWQSSGPIHHSLLELKWE